MTTTKQTMPLPNWEQYKIVPEDVIKEHLRTFWLEIDWNRFWFDCHGYTTKVIRLARPNWTDIQVELFDIDCSIYAICE
jgi:uncharacterized protein (UPF0128 family)